MQSPEPPPRTRGPAWSTLAALYGLPVVLLVVTGVQTRVPVSLLMRDPAAIAELPFYTGALSNVGVLLWCATASVCLLTALVLTRVGPVSRDRWLLLSAGGLSAVLMLDDLFQLHEVGAVLLGVPDPVVTAVYVPLTAGFLLAFAREIRRSDHTLLLVALGFFALSVMVDVLDPKALIGSRYHLLEDGPKLLGIVSWLGYFGRLCLQRLSALVRSSPGAPSAKGPESRTAGHEPVS